MLKLVLFTLLCFYTFTLLAAPTSAQNQPNLFLKNSGNKVDIYLNPSQPISALAFKLLATNLDIVDSAGKPVAELSIDPSFTSASNWLIPFKKVVRQNQAVWLEFAAVTLAQTGWQAHQPTLLGTFYVTATGSPASLSFDAGPTAMMTKSTAQNIISIPAEPYPLALAKPSWWQRILSFFRRMLK